MADGQWLSSWNDSAAKSAILDFVARVTKQGGTEFVPPAGRIATALVGEALQRFSEAILRSGS
jgi:hypothetical protein